jgi:hypothetical protein
MLTIHSLRTASITARVLLGLIFLVFGLNFFLHFIPNNQQPEGKAAAFLGGLFQTGYFFLFLKSVEVIAGLLLLMNLFVPLILIILMPISLNILLFHSFLEPSGMALAISGVILVLQLFLAWGYRSQYRSLFVPRPSF